MWLPLLTLALVCLLGATGPSYATQEPPRARAVRVDEAPVIDGRLDDPVWRQAFAIEQLTQVEPEPGAEPSERTVIYIASDEENLYLGFRCYVRDPSTIVAQRMQRDDLLLFDDRISIVLDTFHDHRNGFFFQVNPLGARRDAIFEGAVFEDDWDGIWYAKARIDAEGWTAEIAIPYRTLSYNPSTDTWGLNIERGIRRNNENVRWADPDINHAFFNMGHAGILEGMLGISQGLGLDVKSSLSLRRIDDPLVDEHRTRVEPSGDISYKLTPSLTVTATANTDFGETEIDETRTDVTRFAFFFPEKRDFFLQDAGIFEFADMQDTSNAIDSDTDANGRPFFSRRIGLSENGREVGILAGGKLTGRIGRFNLGLLDVQTEAHDGISSKNLGVARASMNLFGESKLGVIVTNGDPNSNDHNTLAGSDFNYRNSNFFPNRVLEGTLWVQRSFSEGVNSDEMAFGARLEYPNDIVHWSFTAREIQKNFNPALGFVNRAGIRRYEGKFRYRFRPEGAVRLVDHRIEGKVITNTSNKVETWRIRTIPITIENDLEDQIQIFYDHDYDEPKQPFPAKGNVFIPAGSYHYDRAALALRSSQTRALSAQFVIGGGSFFSGYVLTVSPLLDWRPSPHWLIGLEYRQTTMWLEALIKQPDGTFSPLRDEKVVLRTARVRVEIAFTPDISWNTFVQWDDVSDQLSINSRLRWIVQEGREIFLVLNQGFDSSDGLRRGRTEPLAKIAWTFRF